MSGHTRWEHIKRARNATQTSIADSYIRDNWVTHYEYWPQQPCARLHPHAGFSHLLCYLPKDHANECLFDMWSRIPAIYWPQPTNWMWVSIKFCERGGIWHTR